MESNRLPEQDAQNAADFLRSLANEHRLQILCHLLQGEMSVGELNALFPLSQSSLSQHLSVLRNQGLVSIRKSAQTRYYSIHDQDVLSVIRLLKNKFCPE